MKEADSMPRKRDDYFRCPICLGLFPDSECSLDPIKGYVCPNNCIRTFEQPKYESPFNDN